MKIALSRNCSAWRGRLQEQIITEIWLTFSVHSVSFWLNSNDIVTVLKKEHRGPQSNANGAIGDRQISGSSGGSLSGFLC